MCYLLVTGTFSCVVRVSDKFSEYKENPENTGFSGFVALFRYSVELSLAELRRVTAAKREDETGRKGLVFVMNFNDRQVRLEGIGKQIDAESGEVYENVLEMAPFSCTILKLK